MNSNRSLLFLAGILAVTLSACSGSGGSSSTASGSTTAAAPQDQTGAGPAQGGGAARGRRFGELLKSLNLTPDQTAKVREIVAAARKKSEGADRETRRANMRAAYAEIENTVLTPSQKADFEKKMAAMRASYQHSPAPAAQ